MNNLSATVRHSIGSFSLSISFVQTQWPVVLFGPSGAGKSTLLRILAGLQNADECDITFNSQPLPAGSIHFAEGVQFVSQRPSLFPHLSVADNVAFGLRQLEARERHPGERQQRVEESLRLFAAERLYDRMPRTLSGGEQRRVALARALAPRPRLLLLDEAFSGLDAAARLDLLQDLRQVCESQALAALYVTHEVADAFVFAAEVLILNDGRITAQGSPEDTLAAQRDHLLHTLTTHPATRAPA